MISIGNFSILDDSFLGIVSLVHFTSQQKKNNNLSQLIMSFKLQLSLGFIFQLTKSPWNNTHEIYLPRIFLQHKILHYISIGESNTIISAYILYPHLQ